MKTIKFKKRKIVRLSKIKIPDYYVKPNIVKMNDRYKYYLINKKYLVPIIVDKNNMLVDGYTSYLIAKELKKRFVIAEEEK